jgi:hypothetical protein
MTIIQGAVLKEEGLAFAIIIVKPHVLEYAGDREAMLGQLKPLFPGLPLVLMAQDGQGQPVYHGPEQVIRILRGVRPEQIPWKEYTFKD